MDLHLATLAELSRGLKDKTFSATELTQYYLARIARWDDTINAVITLTEEQALTAARQADKQLASGEGGVLLGIPILHKDIFCTQGVLTSCGSKMLSNFIAPYDATVVARLNAAGSVLLGKTNMDEFAMGSSNETSFYGPVKNPWDLQRVPGGSSGGSAAAMAARFAPVVTGTDTGGSIRQPAAFCGVCGIKPTYGRVSRYGMVAFASSLDQAGVLTVDAQDAAIMLNVIAGLDRQDSTSISHPVPDYTTTLNKPIKGLRIGISDALFTDALNADVADCVWSAIRELEKQGAVICDIELPHIGASVAVYYVVAPAECSSNLARMDGVRFGYRCQDPSDLEDLYTRSRGEGFGVEVVRRIMMGTYVLSAGFYDAYYLQAQRVRQLIAQDFKQAFTQVDIIAGPVTPQTAFKLGEKCDNPVSMYLSDVYTIAVNLAGLPGMSVPCGFSEGLPVGLQLIGDCFDEARLLNVAHRYQQLSHWHRQIPRSFQ